MHFITLIYVGVLALGIGWVIYRLWGYVRAEKEREEEISTMLLTDDQFKAYLRGIREQEGENPTGTSGEAQECARGKPDSSDSKPAS
jgi:hypothetical protein